METAFTKLTGFIALLAVFAVLAGCATLGPAYQEVENISEDSGLVYIYRPKHFVGGGVSYKVRAGEKVITTLHNGGYYPYFSEPGRVEIWAKTEAKSSVTLDVEPGQTYYIKGTVGMGVLIGRPRLKLVPAEVAKGEITGCKLIPEEKEEQAQYTQDEEF